MKQGKICNNPTVVYGADIPFYSVYGCIPCQFVTREVARRTAKTGNIRHETVTTTVTRDVVYYTLDNIKRTDQSGAIYYSLWVYMPQARSWACTRKYRREFKPIYDMIARQGRLRTPSIHVSGGRSVVGGPREKKAQVDFDLRCNRSFRMYNDDNNMAAFADTSVQPRFQVNHTGFAVRDVKPRNDAFDTCIDKRRDIKDYGKMSIRSAHVTVDEEKVKAAKAERLRRERLDAFVPHEVPKRTKEDDRIVQTWTFD